MAFGLELSGNLFSMIHENMRESEMHGNLHGSVPYVPDYGKIVGQQRVGVGKGRKDWEFGGELNYTGKL